MMIVPLARLALLSLLITACSAAHEAQCERWVTGMPPAPGVDGDVLALLNFDPDGGGPAPPRLIIGGSFGHAAIDIPATSVAAWDGYAYESLGAGLSLSGVPGEVNALLVFDADGPGPAAPQLLAGGRFDRSGTTSLGHLAAWDGSSWASPFPSPNGPVYAMTDVDPDGSGPLPPLLIIGGDFTSVGIVPADRIAAWNGVEWLPVGNGFNQRVNALLTRSTSGDLIAAGDFTASGGTSVARIARWDGSNWLPLGGGLNSEVLALAEYDVDEGGPIASKVIAGGRFSQAGGGSALRIAAWDGSAWSAMGTGMNNAVRSLHVFDPDGPGPAPLGVSAAGDFTAAGGRAALRCAHWNGVRWIAIGALDDSGRAVAVFDEDAAGPQVAKLIIGGEFVTADDGHFRRLAAWNGSALSTVGPGLYGSVNSLCLFDPDGNGPAPVGLAAGGMLTAAGGSPAGGPAVWDGAKWSAAGDQIPGVIQAMVAFDVDGPGPLDVQLVAAGSFTGVGLDYVARWDGVRWIGMSAALSGPVLALAVHDLDGDGPAPAELVAGGQFSISSGGGSPHVGRWNGTYWEPLGLGLGGTVRALQSFDPDGDGPGLALLAAAGDFPNRLSVWNGSAWSVVEPSPDATTYALGLFDFDASGPQPARLVVGGAFNGIGGLPCGGIAAWDGSAWSSIGPGFDDAVFAVASLDPDAAGPLAPRLFAGGKFGRTGLSDVGGIAMWDGIAWRPLGGGFDTPSSLIQALATFDPDGDGPGRAQLYVGGQLDGLSGPGNMGVARWTLGGPPIVTRQPVSIQVSQGEPARLSVTADLPSSSLTFRWMRDGVPLTDDGRVTGSATDMLSISAAEKSDEGGYACFITHECGSVVSGNAGLSVRCSADLNGDSFVDFSDYLEFLNLYDAEDPRADFNGDGFVDFLDYLEFLNHYDAGC